MAAGVVLAFALGCLLAGRERSLPVILAAVLAAEAGLHLVFSALGPAAAPQLTAMPGHPMTADHGLAMVIAHAWAGLLASWWLHRGERAAWALLRRLGARLPRLLVAAGPPALPRVRAAVARVAPPRARLIRYCLVERGPPLVSA
ncbi:MAG TPA: hypothetical protein VGL93_13010 [Streptosporangiaceae bacterium]